jgi:hypothetical protein
MTLNNATQHLSLIKACSDIAPGGSGSLSMRNLALRTTENYESRSPLRPLSLLAAIARAKTAGDDHDALTIYRRLNLTQAFYLEPDCSLYCNFYGVLSSLMAQYKTFLGLCLWQQQLWVDPVSRLQSSEVRSPHFGSLEAGWSTSGPPHHAKALFS